MENSKKQIVRYLLLFAGIYIMTLGATLAMSAAIGVCPLDGVIMTFADITEMSIGNFNILFNLIFVFAQVLVLRKEFRPLQFMQFPISFVFGWFVDFNFKFVWAGFEADTYILKIVTVALAMVIDFVLQAGVVMTPIDGFYYVVGRKIGKSTGTMRVCLDTILFVLNLILILSITHVWTLREGTVISLVVLGPSIDLMRKPVSKVFEMVDRL